MYNVTTKQIYSHYTCIAVIFIFFLILPFGNIAYAHKQGQVHIDSLLVELSKVNEDTGKVNLLNNLCWEYYDIGRYDVGIKYANQAQTLAEKLNYKYGIASALLFVGQTYSTQHKYYEALEKKLAALNLFEEIGNKKELADVYLNIGNIYFFINNYSEALKKNEIALKLFEELGDKQGIVDSYTIIGNVYFFHRKDYSQSLKIFLAQLKIVQEMCDSSLIAYAYSGIGSCYFALHNYSEGVKAFSIQAKIFEQLGDTANIAFAYSQLATGYLEISNNYTEALNFFFKSLKIAETINAKDQILRCYLSIGKTYSKQGKAIEGKRWYQKALVLAKENQYVDDLQKAYNGLAKSDSALGNYKAAYENYKLAVQYKDSIFNKENAQIVVQAEMQNEFDKNEAATKAERIQQALLSQHELQRQKLMRNGFIAGFAVMFLFASIFLSQRNRTKKEKMRAEKSEKFKQQFLANMSHEIRTPMNAIMGMTHLVLDTPLNEKQQNYLISINNASENLLHIINEILDLSKIEAGKMELEQIDFSIRDLVEQVKQTLQHKATEKNIDLIATVQATVPEILIGDKVRLFQILMNLVGNAIKFTEKGSVQLSVNKEQDQICFSITDTGIGIPQDKLQSIFESFTQAHSSDTRKYGGTGLGLSISKQLVELMGGNIFIESEVGSGATFSFSINLAIGLKEKLLKQHLSEQIDGSILDGLTILLVDDNADNRIVCRDTLESKSKVEIIEATNGEEALEKFAQHNFDIVLMDVQMPVMNGYEATQQIRNNFASPKKNVPIIALTASVIRSDLDKCRKAGMNDYVPKPFKPVQLFTAIAILANREIKYIKSKAAVQKNEQLTVSPHIDLTFLDNFCEGNRAKMKKYILIFLDSVPVFISKLNVAMTEFDAEEIASQVHGFKTKFAMMGMEQARLLGTQLEADCRAELPEKTVVQASTKTIKIKNHKIKKWTIQNPKKYLL